MGCSSTKKAPPDLPEKVKLEEGISEKLRSRLTVVNLGGIDPCDANYSLAVAEQDAALLKQLEQQQILDFVIKDAPKDCVYVSASDSSAQPESAKRKSFSLGTVPDHMQQVQRSFQPKQVALEGDGKFNFDSSMERVGFACKKGLKPEAPNQDSFCILRFETHALYGVFDGHGRNGHEVSHFVRENLPKVLLSQDNFLADPEQALINSFLKIQYLIMAATAMNSIDAHRSGSTCSLVLHVIKENIIYIAHVGDSRVVLGRKPNSSGNVQAVDLTIDHKPDLPEERSRIEKAGGMIVFDGGWNYRVFVKDKKDSRGKRYPGLNMSRALGDVSGFKECGISCYPDVLKRDVANSAEANEAKEVKDVDQGTAGEAPEDDDNLGAVNSPSISSHSIDPGVDQFVLLCSDGVWEFVSSMEAVEEVAQFSADKAGQAAEHLAALSWDRWILHLQGQIVDDITALVVHF